MNMDTKTHVEELLKTYSDRKREIEVLRYELAHPAGVSENEQITAMALSHGDGMGFSGGHISDKTMYIALNYQEKVDKLNASVTSEISARLVKLEQVQNRLKYYISLLPPKQAKVIRQLYDEHLTQKEVEKTLDCSAKTVRNLRDKAFDALVKMYECAGGNR